MAPHPEFKWWMSKCSKSFSNLDIRSQKEINTNIPSFGKSKSANKTFQVSWSSDHPKYVRSNPWPLNVPKKRHSPGTYKEAVGSSMWRNDKMTCLVKCCVLSIVFTLGCSWDVCLIGATSYPCPISCCRHQDDINQLVFFHALQSELNRIWGGKVIMT